MIKIIANLVKKENTVFSAPRRSRRLEEGIGCQQCRRFVFKTNRQNNTKMESIEMLVL